MKKVNIQMSAKVRLFLQLVCCLSIITKGTGGCSKIASNSNDSYSCTLGPANEIDQSWLPWPQYYPDGGFSIIEIDSSFAIFWPEFESSRSVGNSPFPENHNGTNLNPATPVFGGREPDNGVSNGFDDGGSWIYGVHTLSGPALVGFIHAESHWYPRATSGGIAFKSIGITYSNDYGVTWQQSVPLLTYAQPKPTVPAWTGVGDFCVVYNKVQKAWFCYYTSDGRIQMAMSKDSLARPGTWFKHFNNAFSQPGIAGDQTPIAGLKNFTGGNPAVHFNTYLNRWVMAYHGWEPPVLYVSTSADGMTWGTPQVLLDNGQKTWYPTLVGNKNNKEGGQNLKLYYAEFDSLTSSTRKLMYRELVLQK